MTPKRDPLARGVDQISPRQTKQGLRVALYSPGMVGLGHMRRSLLIAQTLVHANPRTAALFIGEARQAGNLAIPDGVDCLTLPALRKDKHGSCEPRYLDISLKHLVTLRAQAICASLEAFAPDVLVVDHLPRGACAELDPALIKMKKRGVKLVLGLRDVLEDHETVQREWQAAGNEPAIRKFYDAVWVYGDRKVCDQAREYGFTAETAAKMRYVGYLDQRMRLEDLSLEHRDQLRALNLPEGKLVVCTVGGGGDGVKLAETFARSTLPNDTYGIILTGPFMPMESQAKVRAAAAEHPRMRVVEFLAEPTLLLDRADAVICMGGYNSVAEVLSFGKPALVVPRAQPRQEQILRAERLRDLGFIDMLPVESLSVEALSHWLNAHQMPRCNAHAALNMDGAQRLPHLLNELIRPHAKLGPTDALRSARSSQLDQLALAL